MANTLFYLLLKACLLCSYNEYSIHYKHSNLVIRMIIMFLIESIADRNYAGDIIKVICRNDH